MPQEDITCRLTIDEIECLIHTLKRLLDLDQHELDKLDGRPATPLVQVKRAQLAKSIAEVDTIRAMFMDFTGAYMPSSRAQQTRERLNVD